MTISTTASYLSGCLAALLLFGCSETVDSNSLSTPPDSFALTQEQLTESTKAAEKGNVQAMLRLSNFYLFGSRGDLKGWYWLEQAAEAGHAEARRSVLAYYTSQTSEDMKLRGLALQRKWGL